MYYGERMLTCALSRFKKKKKEDTRVILVTHGLGQSSLIATE